MNTKPENISCRPGTTEAMERLAAEIESLSATKDEAVALVYEGNEIIKEAMAEIQRLNGELEETENLAIKQGEWLQAIVNITKGDPGELAQHSTHDVVNSVEALMVERDELATRVSRILELIDAYQETGFYELLEAAQKETPTQSLAHIKAAGAREALQRAIQTPGFSDTVVRVDRLEAVIADMESQNVKS